MGVNVSVIIGCHGATDWADIAWSRAYPSAIGQGANEVLVSFEKNGTIASARNAGAAESKGEWLIFLDADDELAPGYIAAMFSASMREGNEALLAPAVSYCVLGYPPQDPKFWTNGYADRLISGNWLLIGTAVHRSVFEKAGGFHEWPIYEDWDLWLRCLAVGAYPVKVPEAVYLAHVNSDSRNKRLRHDERVAIHHDILRANHPELY